MSLWNPTREERDAFLASCELSYDPMFQASMDVMWHNYLKYYEMSVVNGREVWTRKHETSTKPV